ncbi:MAG: hypothetical protein Q8Q03_02385 [bacterium]|nr:hypothetical protein [bacterium]
MHTNHRHYILLFVSILTIASAIAGYSALYYTIVYHGKESSQVSSKQADLYEKKQQAELVASIYRKSEEERSLLASYIPTQDSIINFIEAVEAIGTTTSVILDISAIDMSDGSLGVHIETQGNWTSTMESLALLENISYSITLNNLRLVKVQEAGADPGKTWSWKMSVDVKTPIINN